MPKLFQKERKKKKTKPFGNLTRRNYPTKKTNKKNNVNNKRDNRQQKTPKIHLY